MKIWTKILIFTLVFVLVASIYLFLRDYAYANNWHKPIDSSIFSHWGSFISGLMASGALIFTYFTFVNQKKENEDKNIREENYRKEQEFENRFFKMIENLQFIVSQISYSIPLIEVEKDKVVGGENYNMLYLTDKSDKIKFKIYDNRVIKILGREALHILLIRLKKDLTTTTIDDLWSEQNEDNLHKQRYDDFYNKYFYLLGHYFRFMYHIILFISETTILDKDKKEYFVKLLQAQVSSDEMGLLFYNAIFNDKAKKKETGEDKFRKLLDEYKFFENIDNNSLVDVNHKSKFYPKTFN